MTSTVMPSADLNTILLRIESAILVKENCKFEKKTIIEIEKDKKRVDFYVQPIEAAHKVDYLSPTLKNTLESLDGTSTEPLWATVYQGDYTNGDIWVPLDKDQKKMTIKVRNSHFTGYLHLDVTNEQIKKKDYDLVDEHDKKLEGASLRLSYEFGTYYEIEFRTGDSHFAPGTGIDVSLIESEVNPGAGVIFANLYKRLKRFNPFGLGQQSTDKGDKTDVLFQINGVQSPSRFYLCKDKISDEPTKTHKHDKKHSYARYRFLVPSRVGAPLSVSVRIVSTCETKVTWFLDTVSLTTKKTSGESTDLVMPCYQWISEGRMKTISLPYGWLPQVVKSIPNAKQLHLERLNEIEVAKSRYQWEIGTGQPSFLRGTQLGAYDLVPLDEKFDDFKSKDFSYLVAKGLQNALLNKLAPLNHVEDYQNLYNLFISQAITKPTFVIDNWMDDAFYGWSTIAGTDPFHFKLCKTVPPQFLKTKDICKDLQGNPLDLEEECRNGRLFTTDYSELAKYELHTVGVQSAPEFQKGRKYSAPCTCLFYVCSDTKLRPIAIQLTQDGPIFTPNDTKWQWMYAKMAVRNANAQYHQLVDHWLHAHALTETYSISLHRAMSRVHPLYRLLSPHLKYTIAINTLARRGLINPGGFVSQLTSISSKLGEFLKDNYEKLDFTKLDFISRLEALGFTDGNKGALTDFPLMDDGLLVWNAMYEFVGKYLSLYYTTDDDVTQDNELTAWLYELSTNGHPTKTLPKVTTIPELQKFVTTVMWTTSCHHSVVNFNQYLMYGYLPNYPPAFFKAIPTSKEGIDEKFIMDSLPESTIASLQIVVTNLLNSFADNEEYLTSERYIELIGEPKAKDCYTNYVNRLKEIDTVIKKRNEERVSKGFYAYTLLMPSHIPHSIAI